MTKIKVIEIVTYKNKSGFKIRAGNKWQILSVQNKIRI
jgi:hypothetical protein